MTRTRRRKPSAKQSDGDAERELSRALREALGLPDDGSFHRPPSGGDILSALGMESLEADLNLPASFFQALLEQSDWSFVIQLHALLEAAFGHLIAEHFAEARLRPVLARLELGNVTAGKLAIAERLDLIDSDTKRFVRTLSEVRNDFVHDVSNAGVDLKKYLEGLPAGRQKSCRKSFLWGWTPGTKLNLQSKDGLYEIAELVKLFAIPLYELLPKLTIWLGGLLAVMRLHHHVTIARIKVGKAGLNERLANIIMRLPDDAAAAPSE